MARVNVRVKSKSPKRFTLPRACTRRLTEKIAGKPEERILSYLMLRSLKQARYSEENLGHFGASGANLYHFTSPIAAILDLIVHRILKEVLRDPTNDPVLRPPSPGKM